MSRNHRSEPLVGTSLILLLGCILIVTGLTIPVPRSPIIGYYQGTDTWLCVLSNATPSSTYHLNYDVIVVEIVSLTTNDSVDLLVFVGSTVAINCTNVTNMSLVSPQISAPREAFWEGTNMSIEVRRAENDAWADMELHTTVIWYAFADYSILTYGSFFSLVVAGAALAVFSIWDLASMEREHTKWKLSHAQTISSQSPVRPAMIALLIVAGGLLALPVTRGVLFDDYELVTVVDNVSSGEMTFSLNETFSSDDIELADLCPTGGINYTVEIKVAVSAGLPVIISVDTVQGHEEFSLEDCTDSDEWLLRFDARADESKQVRFEKPSGTADVDCQYAVKRSVTGPRTNPIPALAMGGVGAVLFLCGLISARKRNQLLQTAEPRQTTT